MEFVNERFVLKSAAELLVFGKFLNSYAALSLFHEVKDNKGNIFLQAHRSLSEKIILALSAKEKDLAEQPIYELEMSAAMRDIILSMLMRRINQKLTHIRYAFMDKTFGKYDVPLQKIVRTALGNNFFMSFITLLFYKKQSNIEHLIEVALYSLVLLLEVIEIKQEGNFGLLVTMFQASFLHDVGITKDDWKQEDDFKQISEHNQITLDDIPDAKLYAKLEPIINNHNALHAMYSTNTKDKSWMMDDTKMLAAILNLVEYFAYTRRHAEAKEEEQKNNPQEQQPAENNTATQVFYEISYNAQKGVFPPMLVSIMETHYRKYSEIFSYARTIAQLENSCLHKNLAVAYPKPKVSQMLCKDNSVYCEMRLVTQPINIVHSSVGANFRLGVPLAKGWYNKCKLEKYIPQPPREL